eukprot:1138905-Pelagomonas_calceolata.AAC.4
MRCCSVDVQAGLKRAARMFKMLELMATIKTGYTLVFAAAMVLLLVGHGFTSGHHGWGYARATGWVSAHLCCSHGALAGGSR